MADSKTKAFLKRLGKYMSRFAGCFGQERVLHTAECYIDGLLSDSKRKSMLGMMGRIRDPISYQVLQHFITESIWKAEKVWKVHRKGLPYRKGILILDDTGFPKQGDQSVGVARQYSGTLGKIGNCQIAVTCILRAQKATWPLDIELYLPKEWAEDKRRCYSSGIPNNVIFQEKWRIAFKQIKKVQREGFKIECVVADAAYGTNSKFREKLDKLHQDYVLAVNNNTGVFIIPPRLIKPLKTKLGRPRTKYHLSKNSSRPCSVQELAEALPLRFFRRISWRKGSRGPLKADFAAIRVTPSHGYNSKDQRVNKQKTCWLLVERSLINKSEFKFYFSNLSEKTPIQKLVRYAHSRWAIEQNYQQLKNELGMDHFEGRSWDGWHHHTVLTAIAFTFLEIERQLGRSPVIPPLPAFRKLISEIIVAQIFSERPDLQAVIQQNSRDSP